MDKSSRRPRLPVIRTPRVAAQSGPARMPKVRLSVDQYHVMIEQQILEEGLPMELLDGELVWKDRSAAGADAMTVGDEHAWVVSKAIELSAKFRRRKMHIRVQSPVTLSKHNEPGPDIAIIAGDIEQYTGRHPGRTDVFAVIEVADSSLARDRGVKLRIYANAGIPLYIILNLQDRVAEVYEQPVAGRGRYAKSDTVAGRSKLPLPGGVGVAVQSLFPPRKK